MRWLSWLKVYKFHFTVVRGRMERRERPLYARDYTFRLDLIYKSYPSFLLSQMAPKNAYHCIQEQNVQAKRDTNFRSLYNAICMHVQRRRLCSVRIVSFVSVLIWTFKKKLNVRTYFKVLFFLSLVSQTVWVKPETLFLVRLSSKLRTKGLLIKCSRACSVSNGNEMLLLSIIDLFQRNPVI